MSKKIKLREEEKVDRLTDLPDLLIHHIVSFLDTKYVVRMSLVSKTWRNFWSCVRHLKFYGHNYDRGHTGRLVSLLREILSRRDSFDDLASVSVVGFHIIGQYYPLPLHLIGRDPLTQIVRYAIQHNIRHLDLDFDIQEKYPFSALIHSPCKYLHTLKLNAYKMCTFEDVRWWPTILPALTHLHLEHFCFSREGHLDMFSSFMNLRNLNLIRCTWPDIESFEVVSPYLESLTVRFNTLMDPHCGILLSTPKLRYFNFAGGFPPPLSSTQKLPSLERLEVRVSYSRALYEVGHPELLDPDEVAVSRMVEMFQIFDEAKFVKLSQKAIEVLSKFPSQLEGQPVPNSVKSYLFTPCKFASLDKEP